MSDAALKRRYLKAMGIPLWERRRWFQPAPATAEVATARLSSTAMSDEPLSPPALTPQNTMDSSVPDAAMGADEKSTAPSNQAANLNPILRESTVALELDDPDPRVAHIVQLNWEALQTEVSGCVACDLHKSRTQTVFGVGNRCAQWLIIGEAPGADEDRLGEPFVGRAGKLLDAMLAALKLDREQVYIANILKCRPPKNRDPLPEEAQCCWPFLARQIDLLRPRLILAVGRIAAQRLLQTEVAIGKLRGQVHRLPGSAIPVIVSYHPAYLLRSPREKRKAWQDLQLAQRTLTAQLDGTFE